ncbi:MAG: sigma-54-dependent Fis family transcriptional regulator [Firmicutes bacterium]|nr:sigma-54-dependent Fis family transcriptional regulator [Bacillota bacterium]
MPTNAFRENKEIMRRIFEVLPQGAVLFKEGKVQLYNERLLEILGISKGKDIDKELEKQLAHFATGSELKRKYITLNLTGGKKDCLVTVQRLTQEEATDILYLEELAEEQVKIERKSSSLVSFNDIIGVSAKINEAKRVAAKVANSSSPVLLYGESGTGKELFAQAIHNGSLRSKGPFIAVNCGAIPAELVESELFGYEPGTFTGALKSGKSGLLEAACGGTIFLDEVESMPLPVQVKLLRVISSKQIVKVGGTREISFDARIISASKKDLLKEADNGTFREDLFFRISTFIIKLPPLREHREDIPVLANYFVKKYCQTLALPIPEIPDEFMKALKYYDWRGNVRELENVLERAVYLSEKKQLSFYDLPDYVQKSYRRHRVKSMLKNLKSLPRNGSGLLQEGEEIIIESVLQEARFNINESARILGISPKTLYNRINASRNLKRLKNNYQMSLLK